MALLYELRIKKLDPTIATFPPGIVMPPNIGININLPFTKIFSDEAKLKEFIESIKFSPAEQASVNEWKATYGISYIHNVYEIPAITVEGINWC